MNDAVFMFMLIIVAGSFLYFIGHSLIDAYFRRKEKFVNKLQQGMKGGSNGSLK